ncbi:MAG: AraC family transcriptional regulator [Pyrinomonadaceae bacterium]|nr:AraC family transcriptional regulator [Pyrinomonadaceae bacterium]
MQIEWKSKINTNNYLFRQHTELNGARVHRAKVLAGEMLEHEAALHEINVTISGSLITTKSSSTGKRVCTKAGAGNICITPAGQPVGAIWNAPLDNMGILLAPDFVKKTAVENRFSADFEFKEVYKNQDPLIQQLGLALLNESNPENSAGRLYADSLVQTLTLHLLRNYSNANFVHENTNGGLSGYKLRRVQEFINAKLEEDLSLAEIAEIAELSQFHFARAFRKSTGKTPQQYLMERRIERAKELLARENLPIVEISLQTGFKNQSHFTTIFRKLTKYTPKTWRELKLA